MFIACRIYAIYPYQPVDEDEILKEEPIDFIAPENAYKTVNGN